MTEKHMCPYPGCLNNSSRYFCSTKSYTGRFAQSLVSLCDTTASATTHFEFRPTADTDANSESDTDSDSSLWGDSDSEWHEVPEGAFMSDAMAALYRLKKNNTRSKKESGDADLIEIPKSALGSSADFIAFVKNIPNQAVRHTPAPTSTKLSTGQFTQSLE